MSNSQGMCTMKPKTTRKKLRITETRVADDFQHGIELLALRSSGNEVYPRPDLLSLNQYLKHAGIQRSRTNDSRQGRSQSTNSSNVDRIFAVLHNIPSGKTLEFSASHSGIARCTITTVEEGKSILFLRGYASPEWLLKVGNKFNVSPELYRRHLTYTAPPIGLAREHFSSPGLPSSSTRVIQLTIPTICTRNVAGQQYEPEDLQQARRLESEAMSEYFKRLRSRAQVADSVVRKCLLFSRREFVIEQTVSIDLGPRNEEGTAVVWLDCGVDLALGVEGPWCPHPGTRPWETLFCPIIVHDASEHSWKSRSPRGFKRSSSHNIGRAEEPPPAISASAHGPGCATACKWKAAQNACLLPFQYGSKIDDGVASSDVFYAVSEVFDFAASAESQFINLLQSRIKQELSFIDKSTEHADLSSSFHSIILLNLKYIKTQLASHTRRLTETVGVIRNRKLLRDHHGPESDTASNKADTLLANFEYLLQRADTLSKECEQGMVTLTNSAMLEEARRSASMAMRVQRLTVVATIFIPLSFVCSIWGMNFTELGSGTKPLWMWFASAAPVILFSGLIYTWDLLKDLIR